MPPAMGCDSQGQGHTASLVAKNARSRCAVITNRHNVTGRHQETGACLSKTSGIPNNIVIHFHRSVPHIGEWKTVNLPLYREGGELYWIEHPLLGSAADLVALNVEWAGDVICLPYWGCKLKPDFFPTTTSAWVETLLAVNGEHAD